MNEVKKCSISGVAFTLDADAYRTLVEYLDSLQETYRETPDGAEIVADIEARIAELILSAQDNDRVVENPLIMNIIRQMGSAEDISAENGNSPRKKEPRIPRRLYRDTENAKLGGVCAGIGKYFDIDPVWVRLGLFLPVLLTCFQWVPLLHWTGPMMGNLFGILLICYFIMWFAVPAARTARQKLEMNGERITERSIREMTEAASAASGGGDADSRAKPIVANVVSALGQVVLILLKIFAGLLVFGLIMAAFVLIIGLFAVIVGGSELLSPVFFQQLSIWVVLSGIFVVLIPVILLIYVLMCLIASRKPGGKTVLVIFLLWLCSIATCTVLAIRDEVGERFRKKRSAIERMLDSRMIIEGDTTTVRELLEEYDSHNLIEDGRKSLHIDIPSKQIDIVLDKERGELQIETNGKRYRLKADEKRDSATLTVGVDREETAETE